jgi:hypothetical protein
LEEEEPRQQPEVIPILVPCGHLEEEQRVQIVDPVVRVEVRLIQIPEEEIIHPLKQVIMEEPVMEIWEVMLFTPLPIGWVLEVEAEQQEYMEEQEV